MHRLCTDNFISMVEFVFPSFLRCFVCTFAVFFCPRCGAFLFCTFLCAHFVRMLTNRPNSGRTTETVRYKTAKCKLHQLDYWPGKILIHQHRTSESVDSVGAGNNTNTELTTTKYGTELSNEIMCVCTFLTLHCFACSAST